MIRFEPPQQGWRVWLRRKLRYDRRDWQREMDLFFARQRLEIGRAVADTISDPAMRGKLMARLDEREGQLREEETKSARLET